MKGGVYRMLTFHITDGEFKLSGSINRVEKTERIHPTSCQHSQKQKRGKSSGADHIREIPTLNNSQRQAKHVASITPDKKEKKQLII